MKINDIMKITLTEALAKCDVTNTKICSNDKGKIEKIIVEYSPQTLQWKQVAR